jgi:outer membrane protein TolC
MKSLYTLSVLLLLFVFNVPVASSQVVEDEGLSFYYGGEKYVVGLLYDFLPEREDLRRGVNYPLDAEVRRELVALLESRGGVRFVESDNLPDLLEMDKQGRNVQGAERLSVIIATGPRGSAEIERFLKLSERGFTSGDSLNQVAQLASDKGLTAVEGFSSGSGGSGVPLIAAYSPELLEKSIEKDKALFKEFFGVDSVVLIYPLDLAGESLEGEEQVRARIDSLTGAGVPVLAFESMRYLEMGAAVTFLGSGASVEGSGMGEKVARETALRALKVIEGRKVIEGESERVCEGVGVFPTAVEVEDKIPWINLQVLKNLGVHPNWSLFEDVAMINVESVPGEETTLAMAVSIALENSIKGKIAESDLLISQKDAAIARSALLPSLELSGSAVQLSENLVRASMGQRGEFTFTGSLSLRQVIYSEAAYANIAIKKLMEQMEVFNSEKRALDIILEVAEAYTNLVFSRNYVNVANRNVNASLENLQLARSREKGGDIRVSDVKRWESELSMNRMELNDAQARHRAAMYRLNQLLGQPVETDINVPDSLGAEDIVSLDVALLERLFSNPYDTERYADFVIERLYENSPELRMLGSAEDIAQRRMDMYRAQRYVPEIALIAGADQAFIREGTISNPQLPVPPPPDDITWNVGVRLSFPLFNGGRTRKEIDKARVQVGKVQMEQEELRTTLLSAVMSNVQFLSASYREMQLAEDACGAAEHNYNMVMDAYANGMADVSRVIDAQKVLNSTRTMVLNARAQFVLDYLKTERLQGSYTFLESEEQRDLYQNLLITHLK